MTSVEQIEWVIKDSGRLIPKIHVKPITVLGPNGPNEVSKLHGHNPFWLQNKEVGVGAIIFVTSPTSFNVNLTSMPDIPQVCLCGTVLVTDRSHLICINKFCDYKGKSSIFSDQRLFWITQKRLI